VKGSPTLRLRDLTRAYTSPAHYFRASSVRGMVQPSLVRLYIRFGYLRLNAHSQKL
jgi:hypothetical protein